MPSCNLHSCNGIRRRLRLHISVAVAWRRQFHGLAGCIASNLQHRIGFLLRELIRMEMQQVRYFLALAKTLNFTRAAAECHVSQPALTRSIKQLEDELGGALIRRERGHSHLTELGRRMLPTLQQCYEAAVSAKAIAKAVHDSDVASINIAVANCVNMAVLAQSVAELARCYPALELKIRRGAASAILDALKDGEVDIAIAGPLSSWERLNMWPLFREQILVAVNVDHRFGRRIPPDIAIAELAGEVFLRRADCELRNDHDRSLAGFVPSIEHEVEMDHDLLALLEANAGVAFLSVTAPGSARVRLLRPDIELSRTISVFAIAGRMNSAAGGLLLSLLRAADWSPFGVSEPV
ncbi:LysR family transcriptional regulator [Mesorhizobium sp. CN2-181]|uniref:LysR family transcriptional regulator n=1 Tax=Mesorhizobium yinganensis TaxID=3157707 RepID=UPI0032B72739